MLHSLFILGSSGGVVLEKHWRDAVPRRLVDELWGTIDEEGGPEHAPPVHSVGEYSMLHVRRGKLLFVGALACEAPSMVVIELLGRICNLFTLYIHTLSEESLRANFVTCFQLLDEIVDNGFPLHTEPNVLSELVMQPGKLKSLVASVRGESHVCGALPEAATSSMPWRSVGLKYTANEVYLDLVERIDATVDGRSGVLRRAALSDS